VHVQAVALPIPAEPQAGQCDVELVAVWWSGAGIRSKEAHCAIDPQHYRQPSTSAERNPGGHQATLCGLAPTEAGRASEAPDHDAHQAHGMIASC